MTKFVKRYFSATPVYGCPLYASLYMWQSLVVLHDLTENVRRSVCYLVESQFGKTDYRTIMLLLLRSLNCESLCRSFA